MAAGEYVSVRSQRELFEHQIGLERDELAQYPEAEAQELALIYAAKGLPAAEATRLAAQNHRRPRARARHAGARGAGAQSRRARLAVGRGDLVVPVVRGGALLPLAPFIVAPGPRALPIAIGVTAVALFAVGALLSLFTGRNALCSGARMLVLGAARRRRHLRGRPPRRSRAWLMRGACRAAAEARAREVAAAAASVDLLRRDRRASTARPRPAHGRACRARTARSLARAAYSPASQIRARVWTFDARETDRRGVLRAAGRARGGGARRDARRAATPAAGWCTANPTACPASSPTATATPSSCSSRRPAPSAGATRSSTRWPRRPGVACVVERSDAEVRALEGLRAAHRRRCAARCPRGDLRRGRPRLPRRRRRRPEDRLLPRPARQPPRVRALAAGREVLNVFCYTGGFTLAALAGGAARVAVDRQLGRRARARAREPARSIRRSPPTARTGSRPTRSPSCASCATPRAGFDLIVARPAQVRADRGARRARGPRLQGRQPAGR